MNSVNPVPSATRSYLDAVLELLLRRVRTRSVSAGKKLEGTRVERCAVANREHRKSWRQFMHVGHKPGIICCADDAYNLPRANQIGLLVHELGHLLLMPAEHDEPAANKAGEKATSLSVWYDGPFHLEKVVIPPWLE